MLFKLQKKYYTIHSLHKPINISFLFLQALHTKLKDEIDQFEESCHLI